MLPRREFLWSAAAAGATLFSKKFASPLFAPPASADSRIEIILDEPLGSISPNIYGHFAENLSGVIYDGIWVGENSKVPNINGICNLFLDHALPCSPMCGRRAAARSVDARD